MFLLRKEKKLNNAASKIKRNFPNILNWVLTKLLHRGYWLWVLLLLRQHFLVNALKQQLKQ